jgi:hypothetical protein
VKEPDSRNADLEETEIDSSSSPRKCCFNWAVVAMVSWLLVSTTCWWSDCWSICC